MLIFICLFYLFIIAPPISIEIVGHENSSKYEVQENSSIKLQCIAKDAKPAARVMWYRDRSELTACKNFLSDQKLY